MIPASVGFYMYIGGGSHPGTSAGLVSDAALAHLSFARQRVQEGTARSRRGWQRQGGARRRRSISGYSSPRINGRNHQRHH
jgi:hypothetical protein